MNPQIVFNINLAPEAAAPSTGQMAVGAASAVGSAALPTPVEISGAVSGTSERLPTPIDVKGMTADAGIQQLPTPMDAVHAASVTVSGDLPTPLDARASMAGAQTAGLPEPTMHGAMATGSGMAEGGPPRPEDLDPSKSGYQSDEERGARQRHGRK
jgi:hypothetical protein